MKNLKSTVVAIGLILMVCESACTRTRCYHCYGFLGTVLATKSGDTIYREIPIRSAFQDSINLYAGQGYNILVLNDMYSSDPPGGSPMCIDPHREILPQSDSCVYIGNTP